MSSRRFVLLVLSIGIGVLLMVFLIRMGKIDLLDIYRQVGRLRWTAFANLFFLNLLLVLLSTEKWRTIDACVRRPNESVPPLFSAFSATSMGMALGLIVPTQLGIATARTFGTYFHGRGIKRGTGGTLLEQSFDVLIVVMLTVCSLVVRLFRKGGMTWTLLSASMIFLVILLASTLCRIVRWLGTLAAKREAGGGWFGNALRGLAELRGSALLQTRIVRRMIVLSAVRFCVVVLMANTTAEAVGTYIPLWHLAFAVPFVTIATAFSVTPGGLGLNELTYSAVLNSLGNPMTTVAQWTIVNRVLITASTTLVAACCACVLTVQRLIGRSLALQLKND
jgi:uncharacterized membrane protein YbhN (UPF0104 family)